jgi:acyl-homoserine-lactone acylase
MGRRVSLWLFLSAIPVGVAALTGQVAREASVPAVVDADAQQARIEADGKRATIRRDRYGVPHILADTEEAAAFAQGYATAEDHGAELAQLFLHARGALASVFGERYVEEDLRVRTLGIHEEAGKRFDELPPFMQRILAGYAAGYTFYFTHHPEEFPNWATPVTAIDVLAHARAVMLLDFALDLSPWTPTPRAGTGSNVWVIGRTRSASGHGMLMANPHVKWDGSTLFHEVHLTVPGVINISGATFIGIPVVTIGFNDVLGWSHTVNGVHGDAVYELKLDATRSAYEYDGGWLPLQPRTVSLDVKTPQGAIQSRTQTVYASHYGPIIRIEHDKAYAYKSVNLANVNFLTQWNAMAKARSLQTFMAAVQMQQLPTFNLAYADRDGNIWYVFNGRLPIRAAGEQALSIVPGHTSKSEWFAIHPLSDLPQLLNPRTGYLQNCNDPPWYANLEQRIDRAPFAGYITDDSLGWRGQESLRVLSTTRAMTLDRLMRNKFDASILVAVRLKGELLKLLRARGSETAREGARVLAAWDNQTDAASRGASLFLRWWNEYSEAVPKPFRQPWSPARPIDTPTGIADPARAVEVFERVVPKVKKDLGALDVAWGDVHRLRRGSLDLPLGGSPATLQSITYRPAPDGKLVATGGDSYVLAVEFRADGPRAFSIVSHSESSNPRSGHYTDQTTLYAREQFKPSWFAEPEIAANLEKQYHPDR